MHEAWLRFAQSKIGWGQDKTRQGVGFGSLSIAAQPMIPGIFWLTADGRSLAALPGFICRAALK
jgi:hypothetical protein